MSTRFSICIRVPFGALAAVAILSACSANRGSFGMPTAPVSPDAASHRKTFNYTGGEQPFKVPAGVTSIDVDARGAAGAGYITGYIGQGGRGGRVTATMPVQPGQMLYVYVGGEAHRGTGGFNGGGNGGGWGGGGASDVRAGGHTLADRIFVAGGGGGGGGNVGSGTINGGGGGGKKGGNGKDGRSTELSGGGGGGGTQTKGGAGGHAGGANGHGHADPGSPGRFGVGGSGGNGHSTRYVAGSGGSGGGGYYGGGGGGGGEALFPGGGGGGGSGYVEPSATNVHFQRDAWDSTGDGKIIFSW
jgi:hypothetical protein